VFFFLQEILSMKTIVSKLQSIHALTIRKHKLKEHRNILECKIAARKQCGSRTTNYCLHPAWCARRDSLCEISDPLQAINYVMNNLTQDD